MEAEIETVEADAPPPPPPRPRATAPAAPPAGGGGGQRDRGVSRVVREMRDEEDQDLKAYIDGIAGDSPIQIAIVRKRPNVGPNGENILGTLETVEDKIDEEYLFDVWGGGTYELKIKKQNAKGSFEFFKSRTIKIGGEPKMNGRALVPGSAGSVGARISDDEGLVGKTLDMYERASERERARAERLERDGQKGGLDFHALQAFQAPLIEQLRLAQEKIAELQIKFLEVATKAPERDEFRDRLLERSVEGGDKRVEHLREQYEGRIAAQREQYENRLDKLRDNHADDIKRLEDRHRDDLVRMESRHEREIKNADKAAESAGKGTEQGFQARIDSLKEANARLERELSGLQAKTATLEARKDQTIGEKADELIKVKEALDGIGGGDGDNDAPWYTQLINAFGNSQAVLDLVSKVGAKTGADGGAGGGGGDELPPVGQPFYGPNGGVYVRNPDNTFTPLPGAGQQQLPRGRKKRRAAAAPPAAAPVGDDLDDLDGDEDDDADGGEEPAVPEIAPMAPKVKQPSVAAIKQAVAFMENAVRNNTDPAMFASSARNLVESELLQWIQQVGPENFLAKLALKSGTPLTTQNGRNFVRKVFKHLFEGGEGG